MKRNPFDFSHQNKGFIKYVSCRNWVVRNSAGTRLDSSSLVKKKLGAGLKICNSFRYFSIFVKTFIISNCRHKMDPLLVMYSLADIKGWGGVAFRAVTDNI